MKMQSKLSEQLLILGIQPPLLPEEPEASADWIKQGVAHAEAICLWEAQLQNAPESSRGVVKQLLLHLQQSEQLTPWDQAVVALIGPEALQRWNWKLRDQLEPLLTSLDLTATQRLAISLALAQKQQIGLAATSLALLLSQSVEPADWDEILALFITRADTSWHASEAAAGAGAWRTAVELHLQMAKLLHQALESLVNDGDFPAEDCSADLKAIILVSASGDPWVGLPRAIAEQLALGGQATLAIDCLAPKLPAWLGPQERLAHAHSLVCELLVQHGRWEDAQKLHIAAVDELTSSPQSAAHAKAEMAILRVETDLLSHELSLALSNGSLDPVDQQQSDLASKPYAEQWRALSRSQLGQDLWVLEKLGWKREGFFVEFGATDGVLLSNTWLLEKNFDWQGICAEPNPKLFAKLRLNRSCQLSPACVYRSSGERRRFVLADAFGGLEEMGREDQHVDKRNAYAEAGEIIEVTTTSLVALLEQHQAPAVIDYLSIDTEGSELAILEGMDWGRFQVCCITVEHNFTSQRQGIRSLLEAQGYQYQEAQWDDWYWKEVQR